MDDKDFERVIEIYVPDFHIEEEKNIIIKNDDDNYDPLNQKNITSEENKDDNSRNFGADYGNLRNNNIYYNVSFREYEECS